MEIHNAGMNEVNQFWSAEKVLKQLANIQIFIDVKTNELVAFRNLRLDDIILNEIRILEGKLIKRFNQQLEVKRKVNPNDHLSDLKHYPSMTKLLTVIGVSLPLAETLKKRSKSVEDLMALSNLQLQSIIAASDGHPEDARKLITALTLLRKFQEAQGKDLLDTELYWDSWSKTSKPSLDGSISMSVENGIDDQSTDRSRNGSESSNSLLSDENCSRTRYNTDSSAMDGIEDAGGDAQRLRHYHIPSTSSSCITPPSPIRGSRSSLEDSAFITRDARVQQGSPPPRIAMVVMPSMSSSSTSQTPPVTPGTHHKTPHRLSTTSTSDYPGNNKTVTRNRVSSTGARVNYNTLVPPFNKLKPSKSSEWHIGNHIVQLENMSASNQSLTSISTLPPPSSKQNYSKPLKKQPKKRPKNLILTDNNVNFIDLSRTVVSRRSSTTLSPEGVQLSNTSPLSPRTPMTPSTPLSMELMARERDIVNSLHSPRTPKTPKANLKSFKKLFIKKIGRKKLKRNRSNERVIDDGNSPQSVSASSSRRCSETMPPENYHPVPSSSLQHQQYNRDPSPIRPSPEVSLVDTDKTITNSETHHTRDNDVSQQPESSNEDASNKEKTLKEVDNGNGHIILTKDNLFRQPSMMHSEEWDIPYNELEIGDKIGRGRVGIVHRGKWHGDVAIRLINISHNDEEKLRAFKQEIMIYKKTRHENLELFMGSCMDPPRLAIVTGFCKGQSLYNYIRTYKNEAVNLNSAKIIAQHIVQGMGYLHSKGIIHKDLKSKNIFVDGKRVVITDFGLVGLHALCSNTRTNSGELLIPDGWLCYLAPEVIKVLRCPVSEDDDVISTLNHTKKSDVFAFGTVWYELLSGSWPFKGFPAESIIWQAGSGKKQNFSQLQGGKDVKDILMQCWAFVPSSRPDFNDNGIMGTLKKLQTQIQRSFSSHPRRAGINRGVSHERLFDATPLGHTPFTTMHDLAE